MRPTLNALVVQRIEWWSPKPHIQVRFLASALFQSKARANADLVIPPSADSGQVKAKDCSFQRFGVWKGGLYSIFRLS